MARDWSDQKEEKRPKYWVSGRSVGLPDGSGAGLSTFGIGTAALGRGATPQPSPHAEPCARQPPMLIGQGAPP